MEGDSRQHQLDLSPEDQVLGHRQHVPLAQHPRRFRYYSSEEEVLCCGQGEDIDPLQREYAWYNQERLKGNMIPGSGRNEGGWGFNSKYMVPGDEFIGQPAIYVKKWLPPTAYAVITDNGRCSYIPCVPPVRGRDVAHNEFCRQHQSRNVVAAAGRCNPRGIAACRIVCRTEVEC